MDKQQGIDLLFAITKEIKISFESPVILLTMEDYALNIFDHLVNMQKVLISTTATEPVVNIIHTFHIKWLHAVKDIENLKKRLKNTPRETIFKGIKFTMDCARKRFKLFQNFIESNTTSEEKKQINTEFTTIRDMLENVNCILHDKQISLQNQADHKEYYIKIYYEIQELFHWLDRLNDNLVIGFTKVLRVPHLTTALTASLNRIISEIGELSSNDGQGNAGNHSMEVKGCVRVGNFQDLKIKTVTEKIDTLEQRIRLVKNENISMTLKYKKLYFEEQLQTLLNFKSSLNALKLQNKESSNVKNLSGSQEPSIFNHLLPPHDRCHHVDILLRLWDDALCGTYDKSFAKSIINGKDENVTLEKSNDFGDFTVDDYGRKIYCRDNKLYQLNEKSKLVLVNNDEQRVYYYDKCGRYYISYENRHIHKHHDSASEYFMDSSRILVKIKGEIDGVEYFYDQLGSYYINEHGKHIYRHRNTDTEYEQDSFGNLVRVRDDEMSFSTTCPIESIATNDSKYIKRTVGVALKKCIAQVIIHQPQDPITYLADCLDKYRNNVEARQKLLAEDRERMAEIKLQMSERELQNIKDMQNTSEKSYYEEEEQSFDYGFSNYETPEF